MKEINRYHIVGYAILALMILAIFIIWGLMFTH